MSSFLTAIIGLVQGLTEFLPVSSSAHLAFFQKILNIEAGLILDVAVHVGTALAVIVVFRKQIALILGGFFKSLAKIISRKTKISLEYNNSYGFRFTLLLLCTSIPAAILGIAFEEAIGAAFDSLKFIGCALLITGVVLWMSDFIKKGEKKDIFHVNMKDALLIGLAQGITIMPGISRSGMTICMALFLGLDRGTAANYSFLASLPVILGAGIFQVAKGGLSDGTTSSTALLIGVLVSFLSGIIAVGLVKLLVKRNKYRYFSYYVWVLGIVMILFF